MGMMTDHARSELELVGQFDEDPRFAQSLVAAVSAFESYGGHSGGSAAVGISMLHDLLCLKNLSALTSDPDEWAEVGHGLWQNRRSGEAFSEDGGQTYTLLSEDKKTLHLSKSVV